MSEFYFIKSKIAIFKPQKDAKISKEVLVNDLAGILRDDVAGSVSNSLMVQPFRMRSAYLNYWLRGVVPKPIMLLSFPIASDTSEKGIKFRLASSYSRDQVHNFLTRPWLNRYVRLNLNLTYLGLVGDPVLHFRWIAPADLLFSAQNLERAKFPWSYKKNIQYTTISPSKRSPHSKPSGDLLAKFHDIGIEPSASIYLNTIMKQMFSRILETGGRWEESEPGMYNIHLKKFINKEFNYKPLKPTSI